MTRMTFVPRFSATAPKALLLALFACLAASGARAQSIDTLGKEGLTFSGATAQTDVDRSSSDLEKLLDAYKPAGAQISDKSVSVNGNGTMHLAFTASKNLLLKTVQARVDATVSIAPLACAGGLPISKTIDLDLGRSDQLVADNVSHFFVDLCAKAGPNGQVLVQFTARMQRGSKFGVVMGPAIEELMQAQFKPLTAAFTSMVEQYQTIDSAAALTRLVGPGKAAQLCLKSN